MLNSHPIIIFIANHPLLNNGSVGTRPDSLVVSNPDAKLEVVGSNSDRDKYLYDE